MAMLRNEMDGKRKEEIKAIQETKDAHIDQLTKSHAKKYDDIKHYYGDITNTNLDIIKQLKDDYSQARNQDQEIRRQMMNQ